MRKTLGNLQSIFNKLNRIRHQNSFKTYLSSSNKNRSQKPISLIKDRDSAHSKAIDLYKKLLRNFFNNVVQHIIWCQ